MRINKFVALATGLSRRAADSAIVAQRVKVNEHTANLGTQVDSNSTVKFDGNVIQLPSQTTTIMLNKPVGYVSSRAGQGSRTIYDLLPARYHHLKPAGRLDKDSSGLLILTDDGNLANQLTHPRYAKTKMYVVLLDKILQPLHQQILNDHGVQLDDGLSKLLLTRLDHGGKSWQVTMQEGRNRQIRRTFAALGYGVNKLHRMSFGTYKLGHLAEGKYRVIET